MDNNNYEKEILKDSSISNYYNIYDTIDYEDRLALNEMYSMFFIQLNFIETPQFLKSLPKNLRVYATHDFPPTKTELGRAAAVQGDIKKYAYEEGHNEVNIWYGYSLSTTNHNYYSPQAVKAVTCCKLLVDSGYTLATSKPIKEFTPFCIYFAKGMCNKGENCTYHHRIPTLYDSDIVPVNLDIFGRHKHDSIRSDHFGVGAINFDCRVIKISGFGMDDDISIETKIINKFCLFGPIQKITIVRKRAFVLLTYCYRAAAEFAMVAMNGQKITDGDDNEVITVRWGQDSTAALNECQEFLAKRITFITSFNKRQMSKEYYNNNTAKRIKSE